MQQLLGLLLHLLELITLTTHRQNNIRFQEPQVFLEHLIIPLTQLELVVPRLLMEQLLLGKELLLLKIRWIYVRTLVQQHA